mgnify:CR=1 FL=1
MTFCIYYIPTWYWNGVVVYHYGVLLIFGVSFFYSREVGIGIYGFVNGFLFSLYGLPIVGVNVIAFIELINDKIKAVWIN